ncbi:MAG: 4-hydroxy-tetrahydrodipicolinate reductase, partial [Deltaproteobacteria bacterium]
ALATADPRFTVRAAVEAPGHGDLGRDAGELAGIGPIGVPVADRLSEGGTICDFTSADASIEHLRWAAEHGAPIVVGSTGFTAEQRREAERLAARMPTLIAPNMSLGVNVLLSLVEDAVARLGAGFDCEVVELHHGRKKDAPSGTALALAEAAARARGLDPEQAIVCGRSGMTGERPADQIGVAALRGGDAVGDHTVLLVGTGERLELTHRASSRDCLATGALEACAWLAGKPAGLYSMRDVIGVPVR